MDANLRALLDDIEHAIGGIYPDQMERAPEGKWCAREVLEHLSRTYSSTARMLQQNLANSASIRRPTFKERLGIFYVTTLHLFPQGRKAPEHTVPRGLPPQETVAQIRQNLIDMDREIETAERKLGSRRIGVHPVLGPLTAKEWRTFHVVHAKHHLRQVEALKQWLATQTISAGASS